MTAAYGKTPKFRVYDRYSVAHVRTVGTVNAEEVAEVEAFVARMRRYRRWTVLDAIIARELTATQAWEADADGTLAVRVAELQARRGDPDLAPLVTEWAGRGRRSQSAKYVIQVRRFIPEGVRFPRSRFTRGEVKRFLDGLDVSGPTKNRYRVALSQFGRWLVQRDVLETNPVRDVEGFGEHDPRMVFLSREDAKALVRVMRGESQVVAALMAGTGMEWQAVERARRRDVDTEARTIFAHGSKNRWRARRVKVTEEWAWQIIAAHLVGMLETAYLVTIGEHAVLDEQVAACERLELPHHTLHDWRHSYAIYSLESGIRPQSVKRQLGHSPHSTVLERVYAAWIPEPDEQANATPTATTQRNHLKGRARDAS